MGVAIQALLEAGMRMEVRGDRLHVSGPHALTAQERAFIRSNKADLMARLIPEESTAEDPVAKMPPGRPLAPEHTWRFLFGCPFTRRMLEAAAAQWAEPLSKQELKHILQGYYLFDKRQQALQDHLRQWAGAHPQRMRILRNDTARDRYGIWAARAPLDQHSRLIAFPGDPRGDCKPAPGQLIRD
jgi:hypothetical protein